jgi:hypothetical protein
MRSFARFLCLIVLSTTVPLVAAPLDDAVAAVLRLRSQGGYSWETTTTKPGVTASTPPHTSSGSVNAGSEKVVENVWADGRVVRLVTRRNGAVVVHTEDGWISRAELAERVRTAKRGGPQAAWLRLAQEALEAMGPEQVLNRVLNDCGTCEQNGDNIDAVLTERGATYWLGSVRLVRQATGTLHLRLRDGLISEFRISAEADKPIGSSGTQSVHVEFESTTTFTYSPPPPIPDEAKEKLDEGLADSR